MSAPKWSPWELVAALSGVAPDTARERMRRRWPLTVLVIATILGGLDVVENAGFMADPLGSADQQWRAVVAVVLVLGGAVLAAATLLRLARTGAMRQYGEQASALRRPTRPLLRQVAGRRVVVLADLPDDLAVARLMLRQRLLYPLAAALLVAMAGFALGAGHVGALVFAAVGFAVFLAGTGWIWWQSRQAARFIDRYQPAER